jgi:prepilin-type N-terminal cleavage/methylation domain-containing protein
MLMRKAVIAGDRDMSNHDCPGSDVAIGAGPQRGALDCLCVRRSPLEVVSVGAAFKMTTQLPRRHSGPCRAFTLVEMLLVVALISLLLAILLPAMGAARRTARSVICMENLHIIGTGAQAYQAEFQRRLPWEGYAEGDRAIRHLGPWDDRSQWFNACPQYAGFRAYYDMQQDDAAGKNRLPRNGDEGLFVCPEAGSAAAGPKDDLIQDGYFMMWGSNSDGTAVDRRKTFWCYGFNTQLDGGVEDRHSDRRVYISFMRIPQPSQAVMISEKLIRPDEFSPPFASGVAQSAVSYKEFTTRHEQGGYLLFVDNHVSYFKRTELIDLPTAPMNFNIPGKVIWNPVGVSN